jgi:protein-disulfide isomerase
MSPQDNRPSGNARERAAAAYAAEQAAARKKRQFFVGGIVLVVILAAVGIGIAVQHSSSQSSAAAANGPLVFPAGTVSDGLAVPYGTNQNAKVTLTIYEDFRCPFCKEAESMFGPIYTAYAQAGKIKVLYHIVNLIDHNDGGTGSIQSGSAAGCAQDVGNAQFKAYHDVLYANQPAESDDAFASNDTLISLAKKVDGLDTAAFQACVNSGKYQPWVAKNFDALSKAEGNSVSTPDYLINGTRFELTTQPAATQQADFTNALNKAIAAAG